MLNSDTVQLDCPVAVAAAEEFRCARGDASGRLAEAWLIERLRQGEKSN